MDIPFNVKEVCRLLETARFTEKSGFLSARNGYQTKRYLTGKMNDEVPLDGMFLTCIVILKVWLLENIFFVKNIHLFFENSVYEVRYVNVET